MGPFAVHLWSGEDPCPGEEAKLPSTFGHHQSNNTVDIELDAVHALIFSSLISAVDPVAVLVRR